ncbi:pentapeptide repeat-containing protein [Ktedonospora formicarum]|uniref:pentapeptide repeat-containing protein n=1 Tax=Ktedonospora formicarum TaxID=2778364 RepID=UPI001C690E52|nr:pentapeptide repeat-containing protein [Ktedonospora formicarum]
MFRARLDMERSGAPALLRLCESFIWAISQFGWDWTGFSAYTPPTPQYQRGKTLWDWFQLLIVPAMLATGAGFFTWRSARTERQIAQQRYEQEQKIADQRYEQDQELVLEKQREDLLQAYLDRMAELLLEKGLRSSKHNDEVRKVARTRTISTLIQLDGKRARTIFVFLREAQLTKDVDSIISLESADLSKAKWSEANLSGFNLSRTNLFGADLSEAHLFGAKCIMLCVKPFLLNLLLGIPCAPLTIRSILKVNMLRLPHALMESHGIMIAHLFIIECRMALWAKEGKKLWMPIDVYTRNIQTSCCNPSLDRNLWGPRHRLGTSSKNVETPIEREIVPPR